jgi:2,5-dioxopentanoate dehydrogenase
MNVHGTHLINGQWHTSPGGVSATNPATGEALEPIFGEASSREVDAALSAAETAFQAAQNLDPRWPAKLLETIARQIMQLDDALLERAELETALPRPRLIGERARTVGQLTMFAEMVREGSWVDAVIDTADPGRKPAPRPDVRRMLRPRGPVVVFGASNFPFAFSAAGGDTASALAAGNPVIVKGHPSHPGTSEMFAAAVLQAIKQLDLPAGLFALLQGRSHELSELLVRHPSTAAVGFTGSRRAGRALFDTAAARPRPIPVFAEMGSLNPLLILTGAIRERGPAIAKELSASIILGAGQFCTKPGLILALGDRGSFIQDLKSHLAAAPSMTMLNQPLRDAFAARVADWATLSGVQTHLKSQPTGHAAITPSLFETTAAVFHGHPALAEEAFGPAALVIGCDDISEAERVLQSVAGSLTGTIHIGPGDEPLPLLRLLEGIAGRLIINGYPTGVEVCHAMVHGGPYPATTDAASTSVGPAAIRRFARMVSYQNTPDGLLPPALQTANPLGICRTINGRAEFPHPPM